MITDTILWLQHRVAQVSMATPPSGKIQVTSPNLLRYLVCDKETDPIFYVSITLVSVITPRIRCGFKFFPSPLLVVTFLQISGHSQLS